MIAAWFVIGVLLGMTLMMWMVVANGNPRAEQLEKQLRLAVAIIRNDACSPIWHHSPETASTRHRWCDEILREACIDEFGPIIDEDNYAA